MLDVSRRLVVVVGGGAVAARKVRGLLDAGATRIRCISVEFDAGFPDVERVRAAYQPGHLDGAGLVLAATDNAQVNVAVVRDAHRLGVLVSRADGDEEEPGDFSSPAVLREAELVVAVSAGGAPALAAVVRDGLRERLDGRWIRMSEAMRELRPRIAGRADLPVASRQNALRDLASEEAMDILEKHGVEEVWAWVRERNRAL
jgi:precorrin-2 dehydrogenase/sirohydrochlorin ferrochelatase